jgi:rare lipoprotein A
MTERITALIVLLALPLCAQEVFRKPSPFPEKNRERESALPPAVRPEAPLRTAPVMDDAATSPAPAEGTGKACFFASKASAGELVAAHATYAFGARVRVTNLANGKTVEVRIVDRFPDARRIISVNDAAARQLGFYSAGMADVKVDLVREVDTAPLDNP